MKPYLLLLAALVACGSLLHYQQLDVYLWQHWKLNRQQLPAQAMGLGRYRVDIEALPVAGVDDDLSALAYNAERDSLFAVLNGTPLLLELSLEGEVLRRVRIDGVKDMEGLAYLGGNRYLIVEEQRQRLVLIELPDDVERLDTSDAPRLSLAQDTGDNKALEGATWDARSQQLLLVRERDPLQVLTVSGFGNREGEPTRIDISENALFSEEKLFVSDLSSIVTDPDSGHLLLLSDESRMVVEYSAQGEPISVLGLRRGFHGLRHTIPQAEGMAMDSQRRLYLVSEPNLFYRFVPPED